MNKSFSNRLISAALIGAILLSPGVFAQQEIVSAIKNDLVARHVSLTGPCGAFEITKRVAWALRSQGVGLLDKPGGNNCQGYSVDYLVFPDMSGRDILGDGGGENIPQWSGDPNEPPGTFAGRWRAAFDPGDAPAPPPVVTPPVPPPSEGTILPIVTETRDLLKAHEAAEAVERAKAEEFRQRVGIAWGQVSKWAAVIGGSILAGGGISRLLNPPKTDPAK